MEGETPDAVYKFRRTSRDKEVAFGRPAAMTEERLKLGRTTQELLNIQGRKDVISDQRFLAILPALEKYLQARAKGAA